MATSGKQSGTGTNDMLQKLRANTTPKLSTTLGPLKAQVTSGISKLLPNRLLSNRNTIKFYDRYDDYYEFTNFYFHPVDIDGHRWPTTEHYFQAQKFVGTPYYDHIRELSFPRDAFRVSRDPAASKWIRRDWSAVKDDVMLKALRFKFQDESLKRKLLSTRDKTLVEHTSNDSYWGDGGDGSGLNKLGKLLMKVRDELRQTGSVDDNGDIDSREYSRASSRLRRSSSLSNLSMSSSAVPTRPTLDNVTNHHPFSFTRKHSEPSKKRRNSITGSLPYSGSHSSKKDLQSPNVPYSGSHSSKKDLQSPNVPNFKITRSFDNTNTPHGTTTYNGDSHQYAHSTGNNHHNHGNTHSHQYNHGNTHSHQYSRGNIHSGDSHQYGNSGTRQHSHGDMYSGDSHRYSRSDTYSGNDRQYRFSPGPYGTPDLTRKSFNPPTSQAAVSTHINSRSRSKYSSSNRDYSPSVVNSTPPPPHRDRSTHKNMSEATRCSSPSLPTKAANKFYGGTNSAYRGTNRPSTSYNIITHESY